MLVVGLPSSIEDGADNQLFIRIVLPKACFKQSSPNAAVIKYHLRHHNLLLSLKNLENSTITQRT